MNKEDVAMIEMGCILLLSIYHLILYFQIRKKYYLYFGLISLAAFIRSLMIGTGTISIVFFFPDMSFLLIKKVEYAATYAVLALIPMFVYDLYESRKFKKYVFFFKLESLALIAVVVFTGVEFFSRTLLIFNLSMIACYTLAIWIVVHAIKKKLTGSSFILYGILVAFTSVILEIAIEHEWIHLENEPFNLLNTGILAYSFFQSVALSQIFATTLLQNERLARDLEDRVLARTEQLTKSNVVKERYVRIISHDLRAPLNNLKSLISLVRNSDLEKKESEGLFDKIDSNLTGSLEMLNELMVWTRATSKKELQVHKEKVELNSVIEKSIALFEQSAKEKAVRLVFKRNYHYLYVIADKNAVSVTVRNLISNGIKFTSPQGKVEIGVEPHGDKVEVHVTDSGIGIPHEMKETIFDMDPKNNRPGTKNEKSTGIGLSMCKDLINQIGGELWVEDNPQGGTVFRFDLMTAT